MATVGGIKRLARCLACGGRIKVEPGPSTVNCEVCGLTLINAAAMDGLPPVVIPRAGRETCWKALAAELRLPDREGAVELRDGRLLLVPYWRQSGDADSGAGRRGTVFSGADLTPIGLPQLTRERRRVRGLSVEPSTRTGDAMGRLAGADAVEGAAVEVFLGPDGLPVPGAVGTPGGGSAAPPSPGWRLVYHPVWSFHYAVFSKEHYHVVDAVTAAPVGPARRVRWPLVATLSTAVMLVLFLVGAPWLGALAAPPAWLGAVGVMRALIRRERSVT